jgi:hypothetical protein
MMRVKSDSSTGRTPSYSSNTARPDPVNPRIESAPGLVALPEAVTPGARLSASSLVRAPISCIWPCVITSTVAGVSRAVRPRLEPVRGRLSSDNPVVDSAKTTTSASSRESGASAADGSAKPACSTGSACIGVDWARARAGASHAAAPIEAPASAARGREDGRFIAAR